MLVELVLTGSERLCQLNPGKSTVRNGKVNIYHNYVQDLAKSIELFLPYIDLKDKVIGDWIDNPTFNEPNPDRPNLND